jgi:hypothetical protein
LDSVSSGYYEIAFERDFLKKTATQFQDFFSEIMEKCHPGDFQRVRPWGNAGDRKNDGYLSSQKVLFQVYAPNTMELSKTVAKIDEDYCGAILHWAAYFTTWVFVHNSRNGLGPDVLKKILDLDKSPPPEVRVEAWGFEELRHKVFTLEQSDLASLLGPAPSCQTMLNTGIPDLQIVLQGIGSQAPPEMAEMHPIPPGKLDSNGLSEAAKTLIKQGGLKRRAVRQLFSNWPDPEFGDRIARAFRERYGKLKASNLDPNAIFVELQSFAGGLRRGTPEHESAVVTVLAYLFEACDIFEPPQEASQ